MGKIGASFCLVYYFSQGSSSPVRSPLGSVDMSTRFFLAMRSIISLDRL